MSVFRITKPGNAGRKQPQKIKTMSNTTASKTESQGLLVRGLYLGVKVDHYPERTYDGKTVAASATAIHTIGVTGESGFTVLTIQEKLGATQEPRAFESGKVVELAVNTSAYAKAPGKVNPVLVFA